MNVKKRVCVVVLGDIGRSPRSQYHARSFIDEGYNIDMIGYVESPPLKEIEKHVKIRRIAPTPEFLNTFPRTLNYIFKSMWQALALLMALFSVKKPNFILCQNPPAIPTLFVCYFYCLVMRSKLVVDWHNYGHTIMAITSSSKSPIVRVAKVIEMFFGRRSHANLCVTKAMRNDLLTNCGIIANVLYDRPSQQFRPIDKEGKHKLFRKLSEDYMEFHHNVFENRELDGIIEETAFTKQLTNGEVEMKQNRPGLLISSTSWTPDEDFHILLNALDEYEGAVEGDRKHFPKLVCVITGKGPLKSEFHEIISKKQYRHVNIVTPWLESEEYPLLLAASDIGVCLHWSSSGLDLPMKVVDMFGCGLPVCAVNFKCLHELVEHGKNGFIFENSGELAEHLKNWFYDFPNNAALYNIKATFRKNLEEFQKSRWHDNWKQNALPLFK